MKAVIPMLSVFLALPVAGQAQTTLRLADSYPVPHVISVHGAQKWIAEVEARSQGRLKIEFYPAQQLGKAADNLKLLQTGVADVASVGAAYVSDKMPLSDVGALPGMFTDSCKGAAAFQKIATSGALAGHDYKRNGIVPLFSALMPPYQIITTKTPVNGIGDLKGLKIRASGGSSDLLVRALGGIPVKMAGPDIREGLDRGTIDANLGPNSSLRPYDIFPLAKFGTQGYPFGSFVLTYSISEKAWDKLDIEDQAVLTAAGAAAQDALCAEMTRENEVAIRDMEALGSKFHTATEAELAEATALGDQVVADWQAGLVARGLPADQVLAEFRAAME